MKFNYRTKVNARAVAGYFGKIIDGSPCFTVKNLSEDDTEVVIYDAIGWPFNDASELIKALSDIKTKTVTVRINSPGGDVFDAMAIFNALKSHSSKVITRVESLAASAASIIALAGKEVQAYSNSMFMIHDPWAYMGGNQYDHRDVADILGQISGNMVDIYSQNSDMGKRELTQIMKDETWFTAKQAKEKGMVDTILEAGKAAKATFDLSMFDSVPDELKAEKSHEPTEREIEKALRDVGVSKSKAKALLAGCRNGEGEAETFLAAQKTLTIFGGR